MPQVLIEVPEVLHDALRHYLELNPTRTADDAIVMGLCLFLMQYRTQSAGESSPELRGLARTYLGLLLSKGPG